jgi:hypothetical protein
MGMASIVPNDRIVLQGPEGKVYGVIENRTLRKHIRGSQHILRKPPAIAIDAALYDGYRPFFDAIEVVDTETGTIYRLAATRFDYWRFALQRGSGCQYAVSLSRWKVENPHDPQLKLEVS